MTSDHDGTAVELEAHLPPAPWAASAARHALDGLTEVVEREVLEHIQLLVSELVTNSFRHARLGDEDQIELRVRVEDRAAHVEVTDPGAGFDRVTPRPDPDRGSGWGLFLVETLASRWGVDHAEGTTVWFDLDRHASPARASATSRTLR